MTKDEGIRKTTNMKILAKLRPAFKKGGSTTAGNSSQVTDGAAAVVLARRSFAEKHKLPIVGRLVSSAIAGVQALSKKYVHVLEARSESASSDHFRFIQSGSLQRASPCHQHATAGTCADERPHVFGSGSQRCPTFFSRAGRKRRSANSSCLSVNRRQAN